MSCTRDGALAARTAGAGLAAGGSAGLIVVARAGETGGNTGEAEVAAQEPTGGWNTEACDGLVGEGGGNGEGDGKGRGVKGLGGRTGSAARVGAAPASGSGPVCDIPAEMPRAGAGIGQSTSASEAGEGTEAAGTRSGEDITGSEETGSAVGG